MSRFIDQDAQEFGLHVRQGGWRLGLLVARSVQPETGGRPPKTTGATAPVRGKVSATEFARQASTSKDRVMRYLRAWDKAAKAGIVPPSSDLRPGQDVPLDSIATANNWSRFYDARQTPAMQAKTASRILEERATAVLDLLTEDARRAVIDAARVARPTFEGPTTTRRERDRANSQILTSRQRDEIDAADVERFGEPAAGTEHIASQPEPEPVRIPEPGRHRPGERPEPIRVPIPPAPTPEETAFRQASVALRDALAALRKATHLANEVEFDADQRAALTLELQSVQNQVQAFSTAYWPTTETPADETPTTRWRRRNCE